MIKKGFTFRLSKALIKSLKKHYKTEQISLLIQRCVQDGILQQTMHVKYKRTISPQETLSKILTNRISSKKIRISVRLDEYAMNFLCIYYGTESITDALRCCIYDVIHNTAPSAPLQNTDKVFYMTGQKNPQMLEFLREVFNDIIGCFRIGGYAEPFCGTGNVLLHMKELDAEFLNDSSEDLINLLRVLQKYPYELRLSLLSKQYSKTTFSDLTKILKQHFYLKSSKAKQIERAVAFYFCRYASAYGKGQSFKKNGNQNSYYSHLDCIYALSQRLQGVEIKKRDALYFAKTLLRDAENFLIYFDAPYIHCEEHYKVNNNNKRMFHSHTALRNRVMELRAHHHICLISYRITASKSMKKSGISDSKIQQILDTLYLNKGFYYRLEKLRNSKGQIEILISTVPFCKSKPYSISISEAEVI